MREVPFTIIDPRDNRWAQLLDVDQQIRLFLPALAEALQLPRELNYVLVPRGAQYPMNNLRTIADHRIPRGAELHLRPLRDQVLRMFLDKLYDEAKDYLKDQLKDLAKDRLLEILGLDPSYPDPLHLKEALLGGLPQPGLPGQPAQPLAKGMPGQGPPPSAKPQPQPGAGKPQAQKTSAAPSQQPVIPMGPAGAGQYQPPPSQVPGQPPLQYRQGAPGQVPPKPKSNAGCIIGGILGGGALLVVGGIIAVVVLSALLNNPSPTVPPGNSGELVLGTGDVQVTLRWDAAVDLDLHVFDPYGEEIWYSHETSASGGILDVDANAGCGEMRTNPVENIYWPTGGAPGGGYSIYVNYYRDCYGAGPVSYEVTVLEDGMYRQVFTGTVSGEGETQFVYSFDR